MKPQHEIKSQRTKDTQGGFNFTNLFIVGVVIICVFLFLYHIEKGHKNITIPISTYYPADTLESDTVVYHYVTMTVYHAVEAQTNSQPLVTASNRKIESTETAYNHRYIALSRDLLYKFPYGTIVSVEGCGTLDGEYIVADTMNKRFTNYGDILINPDMKGGKWKNVKITKIK